jgi:hypothetical protein
MHALSGTEVPANVHVVSCERGAASEHKPTNAIECLEQQKMCQYIEIWWVKTGNMQIW